MSGDLLNRDLEVIEQLNSLKSTDQLYGILIGTTNTRINDIFISLNSTNSKLTNSINSTDLKFIDVNNSLINTAGVLFQTTQRISNLSDIVDTNFTRNTRHIEGNYSILTNFCNTLNSKIEANYTNLVNSILNNDATINAVYVDTLNRISSLSHIKQNNIMEAGINSVLKNNRIKVLQPTGIITITDVNDDLIQIGANLLQYDTAAATQGKINIALTPYATKTYVDSNFVTVDYINEGYVPLGNIRNYYTKVEIATLYYDRTLLYTKAESDSLFVLKSENGTLLGNRTINGEFEVLNYVKMGNVSNYNLYNTTTMLVTPDLVKFNKRIITPAINEVNDAYMTIKPHVGLSSFVVSDVDNNLMRVASSSLDTPFPILSQPKFRLNEYGCFVSVPIYDNPTIDELGSNLSFLSTTLNSILSSGGGNGPVSNITTGDVSFLNIQRGLNGVADISMADYFKDQYVDTVILTKNNNTKISHLTTTTNSLISSVNNLNITTNAINNTTNSLNDRTTVLESVVSGGQGNALTDFYSSTNSVLLLNNKSFNCNQIKTNVIQGGADTITILSNLNQTSTNVFTSNTLNFNVQYKKYYDYDKIIDKYDVLKIISKGDKNSTFEGARSDVTIFDLKRDYLIIDVPIINPSIGYLQNYTLYNTTTQNSIIKNVSILQTTQASILNSLSSLKNDVNMTATSIITSLSIFYIEQNALIDNFTALSLLQPNYIQNVVGTQGMTTILGGEPKTATIKIETNFYNNLVNTVTTASVLQTTTNSIISTWNSKQDILTSIGNDSAAFKLLNLNNIRAITGGTHIVLNQNSNILYINTSNNLNDRAVYVCGAISPTGTVFGSVGEATFTSSRISGQGAGAYRVEFVAKPGASKFHCICTAGGSSNYPLLCYHALVSLTTIDFYVRRMPANTGFDAYVHFSYWAYP